MDSHGIPKGFWQVLADSDGVPTGFWRDCEGEWRLVGASLYLAVRGAYPLALEGLPCYALGLALPVPLPCLY